MPEYTEASADLIHMAQDIIYQFHPELIEARIGLVFRDEAPRANGKIILRKTQKVDAKARAAGLELDFLIWIAEDTWKQLDTNQRRALVDHELCHCYYIAEAETKIRPHDIEEFNEIIERYGLWTRALMSTANAFKKAMQLDLGLDVTLEHRGKVVAIDPANFPSEA